MRMRLHRLVQVAGDTRDGANLRSEIPLRHKLQSSSECGAKRLQDARTEVKQAYEASRHTGWQTAIAAKTWQATRQLGRRRAYVYAVSRSWPRALVVGIRSSGIADKRIESSAALCSVAEQWIPMSVTVEDGRSSWFLKRQAFCGRG